LLTEICNFLLRTFIVHDAAVVPYMSILVVAGALAGIVIAAFICGALLLFIILAVVFLTWYVYRVHVCTVFLNSLQYRAS